MPRHVMSCIYIYAYIKKSPYDVYTKSPFFLLRRIYAVQIVPWIETMNTFARPGNGRKLDVPDTVTMAGNQWTSIILPATSIFFLIHWVRCKKLMCPMIFPWISHDIPMIFPRNWHYLCSPWYSHQTHHHCWWNSPVLPCGDGLINGPWNERTPITSWW